MSKEREREAEEEERGRRGGQQSRGVIPCVLSKGGDKKTDDKAQPVSCHCHSGVVDGGSLSFMLV